MKTAKSKPFRAHDFLTIPGLGRSVHDFKKGHSIFVQGQPADSVFYIQKGKVKLSVVSTQGKEATVALLSSGNFAGEDSVTSRGAMRITSATALVDCTLMRIERIEMIRVIHEENAFSDVFVTYLLGRNANIQADLVDQLFNSTEKRLARTLLQLANFGQEGAPEEVIPKVSQQQLAEMIGCTRSRVSFFMNRFRKLGFIEYNGTFKIHSSLLTVVLRD